MKQIGFRLHRPSPKPNREYWDTVPELKLPGSEFDKDYLATLSGYNLGTLMKEAKAGTVGSALRYMPILRLCDSRMQVILRRLRGVSRLAP